MVLQMGMQDYVESTVLYRGKRVEIEGLTGTLLISLERDVEEVSVAVVGPKTCVEGVVVVEEDGTLLVCQSWVKPVFEDAPILTITPDGKFSKEAAVTIVAPVGTFFVLDRVEGFIRIKYDETGILSFSK